MSPGLCALHLAVVLGRLDIVDRLLVAGANPNSLSSSRVAADRLTPLQLLAVLPPSERSRPIAERLVAHGARVDEKLVAKCRNSALMALLLDLGWCIEA